MSPVSPVSHTLVTMSIVLKSAVRMINGYQPKIKRVKKVKGNDADFI